ncbi:MAG: NfeD family protein [Clostridia bacterium]|nr:NfeD family protein [Clostridia bacterium]
MPIMVWIWLGIFVVTLVVELATPQFVSLWFAISSLLCLGLAFIPGLPWWAQVIIFVVLSTVLLVFLRPICNKYFMHRHQATNTDSLIGREVRMTVEANFDQLGQAKVGDVVWSIKSKDDTPLPAGEIVTIIAIDGNKLIAERK